MAVCIPTRGFRRAGDEGGGFKSQVCIRLFCELFTESFICPRNTAQVGGEWKPVSPQWENRTCDAVDPALGLSFPSSGALAPPPGLPEVRARAARTRPGLPRLPLPGPRPLCPTGSSRPAAGRPRLPRCRGWLHCTPPPPRPHPTPGLRAVPLPPPPRSGPGTP